MPQLWIIAGPNGAGKTTLADRWFATRIPVISPDSIAATQGLSAMQSAKAAIRAQENLLISGQSFAIDTTCSGKRELAVMRRAREAGFKVNLIFVCVESLALCQARIHERVASGGHAVPPEDVARRLPKRARIASSTCMSCRQAPSGPSRSNVSMRSCARDASAASKSRG